MKSENSSFVTVLAWVFIVLSGLGTAMSVLQNVMVYFLFPRAELRAAMETESAATQLPVFAKFMLGNIEVLFAAMLLLSLLALAASIGLLKRQNWARLVLIGLLGFGIAWNLGGLVLQQALMSQFLQATDAPAEFQCSVSSDADGLSRRSGCVFDRRQRRAWLDHLAAPIRQRCCGIPGACCLTSSGLTGVCSRRRAVRARGAAADTRTFGRREKRNAFSN